MTLAPSGTSVAATVEAPMSAPRPHRVLDRFDEVPGVRTLRVVPVDGDPPAFRPAQVSMVGAFGIGEAAISISSAATETRFHEYTIRSAGATTSRLTALVPGDVLWTRGPFGAPWDLTAGGDLVIVAGGIGIAPLRAAIYAVIAERRRFGRVTLVVGARDSTLLLYHGEYDRWRAHDIDVIATIDVGTTGWDGRVGLAPAIVDTVEIDPAHTTALLCGPDPMMRLGADSLVARGVAPERIQLTLERNMKCATGRCGHCQLGPVIVCRDGPVITYPRVATSLSVCER